MTNSEPSAEGAPQPVSVAIPAHNAADTIDEQLAALSRQSYGGRVEVVVVDDHSTDGTRAVADAWKDRLPGLRTIATTDGRGAAHAYNTGVASSTNDIVCLCDADDIVDDHWLERLVGALDHADFATGGIVTWTGGPLPVDPHPDVMGTAGFGFLPIVSTGNLGFTKTAWSKVGGFNEALPTCEDVEFSWRAQTHGLKLAVERDAFIYYRVPASPRNTVRKSIEYGRYQPVLYRDYRRLGMPRQPVHRALARWAKLLVTSYQLFGSESERRAWSAEFGKRLGRLIGSVEARSLFL